MVATIVGYANAIRKTPIVVGDCPGFVVNCVLTPYLLLPFCCWSAMASISGKSTRSWKLSAGLLGSAYLIDVIGLDISHHVVEIVSAGFPERMALFSTSAIDILQADSRFVKKNGLAAFYAYTRDPKGRPLRKDADPAVAALLAAGQPHGKAAISDAEIIERMMLPLIFEAARCLEDGVTGSSGEADMCWRRRVGASALSRRRAKIRRLARPADDRRALGQAARPRRDLPAEREILRESCGGARGFMGGEIPN